MLLYEYNYNCMEMNIIIDMYEYSCNCMSTLIIVCIHVLLLIWYLLFFFKYEFNILIKKENYLAQI